LRVQRAITRAEQQSLTDPRSGLPSRRLIEEQLRHIIRQQGWARLDIRINHYEVFREVYGFVAGDDVLRHTAMLMNEVLDDDGTPNDFLGHTGGDNFIIITSQESAPTIQENLKARFVEDVLSHYSFIDREQGFIETRDENGQVVRSPLMNLSIGMVSPSEYQFADIREITELAAEARRADH